MPKPKMTNTYHFILANSRNIQFSISLPTENWHESFTHFQMLFGYSAVKNSKLTSSLNVVNTLLNKQRYGSIRSDQVLKRHSKIVALPISTSWWVQWLCGLYCLCLLRKENTLDSMITTIHTDNNHVSMCLLLAFK